MLVPSPVDLAGGGRVVFAVRRLVGMEGAGLSAVDVAEDHGEDEEDDYGGEHKPQNL